MAMLKKLTNLLLILALGATVAAGMPLHSNDQGCAMGGEMDCCKKALAQEQTPEVAAARLCCATDCSQSGTTTASSVIRISPQVAVAVHPAATQPIVNAPVFASSFNRSHSPPVNSPSYILHLALLI
jgi:hypothetical protein